MSVLVTGAGVRVGAAIARMLHGAGYAVALHAHASFAQAQAAAAGMPGAQAFCADLTRAESVAPLLAQVRAAMGPVQALVCNAGLFLEDTPQQALGAAWHTHMALHAGVPALLTQRVAEQSEGGAGSAVWILDQRVLRPTPRFFSYTASKQLGAALVGTLAQGLAPHFRVNAVAPGPVLPGARQTPDNFAAQCQALPLQRGPTPEDIAATVLFLLRAPAITGVIVPVDGGQHIAWQTPDAVLPE